MTGYAPARPAAPRRRRHTALIVTIAVVVALVAVVVGGEFYARHRVSQCVATAVQGELGGDVDVSLGATPLLFTVVTGNVSSLSIDSDDVSLAGPAQSSIRGLTLRSTIHDIDLPEGDSAGTVGSSEATVRWPSSQMLASLQTLPFGSLISGVTTDPSSQTVRVDVLGGLGSMTLTPTVSGGAVTMEASDITALGIGLPTGGAQQIIDLLTANLSDYPLGMAPQSVQVTQDGLQVDLRGGAAPLSSAGAADVDCSIF